MFICLECGNLFEEPRKWEETHGLSYGPYEKWSGCPNCHGGYVDTHTCDCCNEWIDDIYIKTEDGHRYCLNCYQVTHIGDED